MSPSSTTKPQTLLQEGTAIVQGRPDDIGVVQVGKTADFAIASQMADNNLRRESVMGSRNSTSDNQNAPLRRGTPHPVGTRTTVAWYLFPTYCWVPCALFEQDYDGPTNVTVKSLRYLRVLSVLPSSLVLTHWVVDRIGNHLRSSSQPSHRQWDPRLVKYVDPSEYIKRLGPLSRYWHAQPGHKTEQQRNKRRQHEGPGTTVLGGPSWSTRIVTTQTHPKTLH